MVEINKTWKDRIVHPFVNFFENFNTDTHGIGGLGGKYTSNQLGHLHYYGLEAGWRYTYLNQYDLKLFLTSEEVLEEIENINNNVYNDTNNNWNNIDGTSSDITKLLPMYFNNSFAWSTHYDPNNGHITEDRRGRPMTYITHFFDMFRLLTDAGERFQNAIRSAIPGKENIMMQTLPANFDDLEITHDYVTKTTHLKYDKPIKLKEHFNYQEYLDGGNTDLFLMIPYKDINGTSYTWIYNPTTKLNRPQFSYIALKITDTNGDGDIKFDHIDKIDYLDGFEVTISTQRLI